jgi:uncharacterized protein (DUF1697 family)
MPILISLLRGINVGGHHKIKMDALRAVYESVGHTEVRTLLQSGNVVFRSAVAASPALARRMEQALEAHAGFHSDVILRTVAEMRRVVEESPFADMAGLDPAKLAVFFLSAEPAAEAREKLRAIKMDPEQMREARRELYIYFPNGQGQSKLPFAQLERALKVPYTARNWNTVTKLAAMGEGGG